MNYSIKKGLIKIVKYFLIFLIPALISTVIIEYPQVYQISLGALLVGLANYLKIRGAAIKGVKLP